MSRRLVISLAVVGLGALACRRQSPDLTAADRSALHAAQDTLAVRMQRGDWSGAAARYSLRAKFMAPNQPMIIGRPGIEASLKNSPHFITFALTVDTIAGMGDMAVLWGHYHVTAAVVGMPQPVVDSGKYLQIQWRQADGSWLTADEMYNSDIPLPAPPAPMAKKKN